SSISACDARSGGPATARRAGSGTASDVAAISANASAPTRVGTGCATIGTGARLGAGWAGVTATGWASAVVTGGGGGAGGGGGGGGGGAAGGGEALRSGGRARAPRAPERGGGPLLSCGGSGSGGAAAGPSPEPFAATPFRDGSSSGPSASRGFGPGNNG